MRRNKRILLARGRTINVRRRTGGDENSRVTYHEGLKVGTPPLGKTISNFPVVVDPVGGVKLARITRWG